MSTATGLDRRVGIASDDEEGERRHRRRSENGRLGETAAVRSEESIVEWPMESATVVVADPTRGESRCDQHLASSSSPRWSI